MNTAIYVILKGCNLVKKIMCVVEYTAVNRGVVGSSPTRGVWKRSCFYM